MNWADRRAARGLRDYLHVVVRDRYQQPQIPGERQPAPARRVRSLRQVEALGRRFLRRLAKRRGILLGQWGAGRNAKLIGWSLKGPAITVAPPRVGKGALIALNLLSPDGRGFQGSTVTIDPRGELWCIAARRRRELGRRALLIRSLRGGGPAQEGQGNPSASRQKRVLQPARLYQEGECRGARHQCPPGRAAHAATPGRA